MSADWKERAKLISPRSKAFIGGDYVSSKTGETFESINPATGQVITSIASCEAEDVDAAVKSARKAFQNGSWSRMAAKDRKVILMRFADLIEQHTEELAILETLDTGKPITASLTGDIPGTVKYLNWYAEAIDKIYDQVAPSATSALVTITHEPMGVVGIVSPWNFPLYLAVGWKVAPALAAGNSVILKPAEESSLTAIRVAELAIEAGLPQGVFNVVTGLGHKAGKALGLHPDVDAIGFTGSTEVGKLFMEYSGQSNLKRISLECGGKSPNIILSDYDDLDTAAKVAAFGVFYNQGESCNAGTRLIVEESIHDEMVERIAEHSAAWMPGDPMDPASPNGAMITEKHMNRVLNYIEAGKAEGSKVAQGGNRIMEESGGYFIEPTIFTDVSNDKTIAREEIFGPVLSVLRCKGLEDALTIANDTDFGLAAGIWTRDMRKAHYAAKHLTAGFVYINNYDKSETSTPFGGMKQSGFGRDKSISAITKYTEVKSTWFDLVN